MAFLVSRLAAALVDRTGESPVWPRLPVDHNGGARGNTDPDSDGTAGNEGAENESSTGAATARLTPAADPVITAVNAAFALGSLEHHNLVAEDHRIYALARTAATDAPGVEFEQFRELFRSLVPDPNTSEYRKALVDATRAYAGGRGPAAD